nr:MAG TPA: Melanocortin-2 receptor accessory protein family [Caudoviricetes sp.]
MRYEKISFWISIASAAISIITMILLLTRM